MRAAEVSASKRCDAKLRDLPRGNALFEIGVAEALGINNFAVDRHSHVETGNAASQPFLGEGTSMFASGRI